MNPKITPKKITIWGSCVTRDTIPDAAVTSFETCFLSGSSLASIPSVGTNDFASQIESHSSSHFHKRSYHQDFNSSWELRKELEDTDLFIVDLIEERGGVFLNSKTGSILTGNLMATDLHNEKLLLDYDYLDTRSNAHKFQEKFLEGLEAFRKIYEDRKKSGREIKLVLNEVYTAERYDNRRKCEKWTHHMNPIFRRCYANFKKVMAPDLVVPYSKDVLIARKKGHIWGVMPFHYIPKFYEVLPRAVWSELDMAIAMNYG